MNRSLLGLTTLVVAANVSYVSAAELTKVGDIFPSSPVSSFHCDLAGGGRLELHHEEIQASVYELSVERRDSTGALVQPRVVVAVGLIDWQSITCGSDGSAIIGWRKNYADCSSYRRFTSDLEPIGPVHSATHDGKCGFFPAFALWSGGYAMAWGNRDTDTTSSLRLRHFDLDDNPQGDAEVVRHLSTHWFYQPALGVDDEGNTVVAWLEGSDGETDELLAAALGYDGDPEGPPILVFKEGNDLLNDTLAVRAGGLGRFSVHWHGGGGALRLAQRLQLEGVVQQTTTTSTTSTTLESDATPIFGPDRGWGREETNGSVGPKLFGDGNGGWLATWYGQRGWGDWQFLASVSKDGGRRWTDPFPASYDRIASDGHGEWFGVRQGWRSNDDGEAIQFSRSSNEGTAWSDPVGIADIYRSDDSSCLVWLNDSLAIGRNPDGTLVVAWVTQSECRDPEGPSTTTVYELYVTRSPDGGVTWSEPLLVTDDRERLGGYPQLELLSAGGSNWLLRLSSGATPLLRSSDDGLTWTIPEQPALGWTSRIACDASGTCVAVFEDGLPGSGSDGDVAAATSFDAGLTWTDPVAVNDDAFVDVTADGWPSVATDGSGRWTVAWTSYRTMAGTIGLDADLLIASSTDDGLSWSGPRVLNQSASEDGWMMDTQVRLGHGGDSWVALWERATTGSYSERRVSARVAIAGDRCGDAVVDDTETCDDGNLVDGDGCDSSCYVTACGNGVQTAGETCDDGNPDEDDSCTSECVPATCGDGRVRDDLVATEECDDGNTDDTDACTSACRLARCGDGFVEEGVEECDDANAITTDACVVDCQLAGCGDGFVQAGVEECDDGNLSTGDRCPASCQAAACGDGFLWLGVERCDPGHPETASGCPEDCAVNRCGDANSDGDLTVSDTVAILSHATGKPNVCTAEQCDIDGNYWINVRDALSSLGLSVGRPHSLQCDLGPWITLRLEDERSFGALQVRVDISGAPISLPLVHGNSVSCESLVRGAMVGEALHGTYLHLGAISLSGIDGPVDFARCRAEIFDEVHPDQFAVTIDVASDHDGQPLEPLPTIVVR